MIKSYGVFAEFYDVLTANIDYKSVPCILTNL